MSQLIKNKFKVLRYSGVLGCLAVVGLDFDLISLEVINENVIIAFSPFKLYQLVLFIIRNRLHELEWSSHDVFVLNVWFLVI